MIRLQDIIRQYRPAYEAKYGNSTTPDQWSALNAISGCRTEQYGAVSLACEQCPWGGLQYLSCGHRSCSQCHHHSNLLWCERQCQKLLPVTYFMVTFTLPSELHTLARQESKVVYDLLFQAARATLCSFGLNDKQLQAELAATAVLHTHSRRLDYHPHLHLVVPGGVIHTQRKEWRKLKGQYLFNHFNLAKVFRGIFLKRLQQAGLTPPKTPQKWVAHTEQVGKGQQALQYLSRYLYRGLLGDHQILEDTGTEVTFWYKDSQSKAKETRTLKGEDLIRLLLIHVLPKGFRRARDYGFLHGNAKRKLKILQYLLQVVIPKTKAREKARILCPCCKAPTRILAILKPNELRKWQPG